jgi:hypothetical protein
MMDKVHKPVTTQYYTPSSKPFRIYLNISQYVIQIKVNANVNKEGSVHILKQTDLTF